jgi:hypothetical protein
MKNPITNTLQSDGMQILAALETAYRALQSAQGDILCNPALDGNPPAVPLIHRAMGLIQEAQRSLMFRTAFLCGFETTEEKEES